MENGMKYFSSTVRQSRWQTLLPADPNAAREEMAWFKGSPTPPAMPHGGTLNGCWGRMTASAIQQANQDFNRICQAEYPSPNYFLRA